MFAKCKEKIKVFFRWIWQECKDIKTLGILLCVIAVVYSPVWGGYLLHAILGWKWASVMASACLLFWAGPFTPFFPICIGITLSIKRWLECRARKRTEESKEKRDSPIAYTKVFWVFLAGSVAGVLIEGLFCLITKGHWESHVVSVYAPYNLLYGLGAATFYIGANKLEKKAMLVRVLSMSAFATVLELLGGLLLRYGLGMRAWNYENSFLNYKGIICLGFSVAWGIAAYAFCKLCPYIRSALQKITGKPWRATCAILSLLIVFDLCVTGASIARWSERHYGIQAQTEAQKELDTEAPDDWMQNRFIEWRFLDTESNVK